MRTPYRNPVPDIYVLGLDGDETRAVQVELHEEWDDAAVDGQLCSQWASANRK